MQESYQKKPKLLTIHVTEANLKLDASSIHIRDGNGHILPACPRVKTL
jgi:hypothetical protein